MRVTIRDFCPICFDSYPCPAHDTDGEIALRIEVFV